MRGNSPAFISAVGWVIILILPPPHHTPLLLPPYVVHLTLYQLFLEHIVPHPTILITYKPFVRRAPFVAAPSFAVAGWQLRTLLKSSSIIVDSFQERLEFGARARRRSLARSLKCRAGDLVVVGCFVPCCRSRMALPVEEKHKSSNHDLNFITDNIDVSLVNLVRRIVKLRRDFEASSFKFVSKLTI